MPKRLVPINYTNRTYDTIKQGLVDHARRYYPNTFRDYSEGSFGSLMLDTVSYVGDILSFYLDYQTNESFLDTAVESENVVRLGKQLGYKSGFIPSSTGTCTFYIIVPSNETGEAPDMNYAPILRRGSTFQSENNVSFLLQEDVNFDLPENEIRVANIEDSTGIPISFAIRAYGSVISGKIVEQFIEVEEYQKFLRLRLGQFDVAEILEVVDNEGNEYFEVDYLSQDVVYKAVTNNGVDNDNAPAILKPFSVSRRFVVERERQFTFLQFGASSDVEVDNENVVRKDYVDPSNVVLKKQGSQYITDSSLDPYKLVESDEFGVSPSNTTLRISMRVNNSSDLNAPAGSVNKVNVSDIVFKDESSLIVSDAAVVRSSLEVINEAPIIGSLTRPSTQELKRRILDFYSTQNRAVTAQDYQAMAYAMPDKFGAVKRCRVIRDPDSIKRNLNMYVLSEDSNEIFVEASQTLKQNLKTWLLKNKMVNDTIDILDAKVINFGIQYEAIGRMGVAKYDILREANNALIANYSRAADIGEPFFITDVYQVLKEVDDIVDVSNVNVFVKSGGDYSDVRISIPDTISPDGRYINIPLNCVYEVKFPINDKLPKITRS
jgi:hypothetical protein